MKINAKSVLSGTHNLSGNQACAEGALAAGCKFLSAYPVSPSIEVINRFTERAKDVDAIFIEMEDEISVIAAILGASWAGKKAMTATSGPGLSLMMENLGLGVMLETPCVIVDIQRAGPSEGIPNAPGQGDIMQARWGSHGDYEIIALCPNSAQEMFDLTVKAFNLSEKYRTPVLILSDQVVGSTVEKVKIPPANMIKLESRRLYKGPKDKYLPFEYDKKDLVPSMVVTGEGYKFHVTGLTHMEKGYPVLNEESQEWNVHRLVRKIRNNADKIVNIEEKNISDAEVVVVSYGITSRTAEEAIEAARKAGIKAGGLRLITIWPFPDDAIRKLSKKIKAFVVPELNTGQLVFEIERCNYGNAKLEFIEYGNENIQDYMPILKSIRSFAK